MDLLIAILHWLGVIAAPDTIDNPEFRAAHQAQLDRSREIIENTWYHYNTEGGVVVDVGVDP